jgi:hypothetical protein
LEGVFGSLDIPVEYHAVEQQEQQREDEEVETLSPT